MARRGRSIVALLLLSAVGSAARAQDLGSDQERAGGKALYDKNCAQCHGLNGDGEGYATHRVKPAPRDFTRGVYKFRTTPSGMLPTDDDLRKVIRDGLPYTSMPGWPMFTDQEVQNIIYHLKTFSEEFQNPDRMKPPIEIPQAPPLTDESIARGREAFEAQGCAACHGNLGRGDGNSAPTLVDEWGNHIRAADMTMRWTYRGGPSRQDVYQTFSTGVNGTPMPSYWDSLEEQSRWDLVNYVDSLGESDKPNYANLLLVEFSDDELDLADAETLFATATTARFALVGQIMEPGRNFYPSATSIQVQAVYNRSEIAFRLRWNDMRAETAGSNSPLLVVPAWDEDNPVSSGGGDDAEDEGGLWGDEEEDEDDIWGDDAAGEDEDDFWGEGDDAAGDAVGGEFSDALAIQLPTQNPSGIVKPYFIFGDVENSVDLWFADLALGSALQQFVGRGSGSITPAETDEFEIVSGYQDGEWTVLIKRSLRSSSNISFQQNQYVPVAFSVWDGFNRERGNKRALSLWVYLYTKPSEKVSAVGPMVRAAILTLVVELFIILLLRWRFGRRKETSEAPGRAVAQEG